MQTRSSFSNFIPDPQRALKMGGMGRMLLVIGALLILVFFVASLVLSSWNAKYWAFDKVTRESAKVDQTVSNRLADNVAPVNLWRDIEILRAWSTGAQFLGMGFLLFGIGIQLASILGVLAAQGKFMTEEMGPGLMAAQQKKTA